MSLPAPMLAHSGRLPIEGGYAFELKWDGFRAIVRAGSEFRVRSRRGWNMTALLPELRDLPVDAVLDGELVALGEDEWPDFPSVCERLLNGNATIPLIYIVFDVLEHDGRSTMHLPFRERRQLLDWLRLHGPSWQTSAVFDDGMALFTVAQERGLEGVVANASATRTVRASAGENRACWRWELEREGAIRARERAVRD